MRTLLILLCFAAHALGADWPPVKFSTVKAYYYNEFGETALALTKNGRINPTVLKSAKVSTAQTRRLLKTINSKRYKSMRPGCYSPRHGFVFFDKRGNIVATYEFCLACNLCGSTPDGVAPLTDMAELAELVDELGLPIGRGMTAADYVVDYNKNYKPFHAPYTLEDEKELQASQRELEPIKGSITVASYEGKAQPASLFSPWETDTPAVYSGIYVCIANVDTSATATTCTVEIKVADSKGGFTVNGSSKTTPRTFGLPLDDLTIFEEPLRGNSPRYFDLQRQPLVFAEYTEPNGKKVKGLIWNERFFPQRPDKK